MSQVKKKASSEEDQIEENNFTENRDIFVPKADFIISKIFTTDHLYRLYLLVY